MLDEGNDATNNPTEEVDNVRIGDVAVDRVESKMLTMH